MFVFYKKALLGVTGAVDKLTLAPIMVNISYQVWSIHDEDKLWGVQASLPISVIHLVEVGRPHLPPTHQHNDDFDK